MIIRTVEYAGTVAKPGQPVPGELPQIAFSGRSNVGKSSLINTLLRRTRNKIAKVSSTPGKTQALNFYRVNEVFFLVDLPGYGYAKVPRGIRNAWQTLIDWYLGESEGVRGVVHLVDARIPPTEHDLTMMGYLADIGLPSLVILTKMDKLKQSQRKAAVARAMSALGLTEDQIVPFSSKTGEGRELLLAALESLLAEPTVARRVRGPGSGGDVGEEETP
ncbi:MAG TPA: ribosome biogenesis GTP-binding protein YihA/YsxC [Longimicrobiales bacterium]|nr:ribosome biogenesis GTP-binding protein YihA/YsxC [Longimicrobiales bacterium]